MEVAKDDALVALFAELPNIEGELCPNRVFVVVALNGIEGVGVLIEAVTVVLENEIAVVTAIPSTGFTAVGIIVAVAVVVGVSGTVAKPAIGGVAIVLVVDVANIDGFVVAVKLNNEPDDCVVVDVVVDTGLFNMVGLVSVVVMTADAPNIDPVGCLLKLNVLGFRVTADPNVACGFVKVTVVIGTMDVAEFINGLPKIFNADGSC